MRTQRHQHVVHCLALVLASVVACSNSGEEMRRQLNELQARNQADSLMTDDSLALTLCDYFDSHGTPNEQMLAHYLLGRTYADMGEAPHALDCYYDAISYADTTSADCDYHTLIGIYGQMSVIFHRQNLPQDEIQAINQYAYYTLQLGDTINYIQYQGQLIAPYYLLGEIDTVLQIIEEVNNQLENYGCQDLPPLNLGTAAYIYTERGEIEKAKTMLEKYEHIPGMFDADNNIKKGWESYYWIKGLYELRVNKLESAEELFRKAVQYGNIEIKLYAYAGMVRVYQRMHNEDSLFRYSVLHEEALDSFRNDLKTDAIRQSAALYDYTRSEKKAELEAQKKREAWYWFVGLLAFVFIASGFVVNIYKKRQKEKHLIIRQMMASITTLKAEHHDVKKELDNLKSKNYEGLLFKKEQQENELKLQIAELEKEVGKSQFANLKNDLDTFKKSKIVEVFAKKALFSKDHPIPNKTEWNVLVNQFMKDMPALSQFFHSEKKLSMLQLHTCILIILDYEEGEIAGLTNSDKSTISIAKSRANEKLFKEKSAITLKYNLKRLI